MWVLILLFVVPFILPVLFFILLDLLVICVPEGRLATFFSVTSTNTAESTNINQRLKGEEERDRKDFHYQPNRKYHRGDKS